MTTTSPLPAVLAGLLLVGGWRSPQTTTAPLVDRAAPPAISPTRHLACTVDEMPRVTIAMDDGDLLATAGVLYPMGAEIGVVGVPPGSISRFDRASGRVLGRIGRAGGGPGEFRLMEPLGLVRDTAYLWDRRLRRISRVAGGRVLSPVHSLELDQVTKALAYDIQPVMVWPDGRLLFEGRVGIGLDAEVGVRRDSILLLTGALGDATLRPLARIAGSEQLALRLAGGMLSVVDRPLGNRSLAAVVPRGIVINDDGRPQLVLLDRSGRRLAVWRLPVPSVAVEQGMYLAAVTLIVSTDPSLPAEIRRALGKAMLAETPPTRMPAFDRLLATPEGFVWVREAYPEARRATSQRWHRLRPDGTPAGSLELPVGWQVERFTTDELLYLREQEDGEGVLELRGFDCWND